MSTTNPTAQPPVADDADRAALDAVEGLTGLPADHAESAEEV